MPSRERERRAVESVAVRVHGIVVEVSSDEGQFVDYVRETLAPFVVTEPVSPQIQSSLRWFDEPAPASLAQTFPSAKWERRPDRDLYLGKDTAYWLRIDDFEPLCLSITAAGESLHIVGHYYFQLGRSVATERLRRLRYGRDMERLKARRFSTLLYYLVYHPLLWHLVRRGGWALLHGGAVSSDEGAVVFSGMPGCGKSTLAVAMLGDPKWDMLSDNLVLVRGSEVIACPEVLLLDAGSMARAGAGGARLQSTGERRVYGRDAYRPDRYQMKPMKVRALVDVERAAATEIRSAGDSEAASMLLADNDMAKEVRRIRIMSRVLDAVTGSADPREDERLRSFAAEVPAFRLGVAADAALADVIATTLLPAIDRSERRDTASG